MTAGRNARFAKLEDNRLRELPIHRQAQLNEGYYSTSLASSSRHFPIGQRNTRPFALIFVEHPHFRQRPRRRCSQASQILSRRSYSTKLRTRRRSTLFTRRLAWACLPSPLRRCQRCRLFSRTRITYAAHDNGTKEQSVLWNHLSVWHRTSPWMETFGSKCLSHWDKQVTTKENPSPQPSTNEQSQLL